MATLAQPRGNPRRTAMWATLAALAMLALGFASVPLYRMFCEATGFGGTTQRASETQLKAMAQEDAAGTPRIVSVRFDSNVRPGMPWQFYPENRQVSVHVGAKKMAIFIAKNMSDKPVTGQASFNVTPEQSGRYFTKIQCFCFTMQTLQPGQEVRMPVLFFVDKKFNDDPDNKDVQEITLSYTFYPVEKPANQS
jgi:cytochrome c oxidase assembly protein subunit 11